MEAVRAQGAPAAALDVIELLTGELLANAVLHGPDEGDILVRTWRSGQVVSVAVSDASLRHPILRAPALTAAGGRGMMLVDALASSWGVDDGGTAGKTVWFTVDVGVA